MFSTQLFSILNEKSIYVCWVGANGGEGRVTFFFFFKCSGSLTNLDGGGTMTGKSSKSDVPQTGILLSAFF